MDRWQDQTAQGTGLRLLPLRLAMVATLVAALHLMVVMPPPALAAAACRVDAARADDGSAGEAEALMAAIEGDFRRGARIVRMDIRTSYQNRRNLGGAHAPEASQKTLWGVFRGDVARTGLLYVFSGPGRLAGTTLLMHDYADSERQDSTWLYLRSFDIFKKIESKTQDILVPGTALSYEDSRGFIPGDRFRFSASQPPTGSIGQEGQDELWILACPRSQSIAGSLGYSSLLLQVDPEARIVLQVEYADLAGQPLKLYQLKKRTKLGDQSLPGEVQLTHFAEGFHTNIQYEYWLPERPPPASLFVPDTAAGAFVQRLKAYLTDQGLGGRIESELNKADEELQAFVDRLNEMKGGKAATSGVSPLERDERRDPEAASGSLSGP